ncbi:MAG TPA: LptA/OstA family protein [bacterium]|nr:LptA/OstA family protein [bacterium]
MNSRISQIPKSIDRLRFLALCLLLGGAVPRVWAFDVKDDREVSSHKPVNISAYQLTFDRPQGLTLFTGNVKAIHDQVVLLADQIRALEENKEATAAGHVKVVDHSQAITLTCGNLEYQDLMDLMTAHDHPLLTTLDEKGYPITVLGRQMEVDSVKKTVVINQNVQILHKQGKAEAQRATFLSKEDKFILEEDPKVYTDNGLLSGRRITANLGEDRSLMVEGMADAIFNPNGKPVTSKSPGGPVTGTGGGVVIPLGSPTPVANNPGLGHNDSVQPSSAPANLPGQAPLRPGGPLW